MANWVKNTVRINIPNGLEKPSIYDYEGKNFEVRSNSDDFIEFYFESRNCPPLTTSQFLIKQGYKVSHAFFEPLNSWCGTYNGNDDDEDGNIFYEEEEVVWVDEDGNEVDLSTPPTEPTSTTTFTTDSDVFTLLD
jgi:hypothetical protein